MTSLPMIKNRQGKHRIEDSNILLKVLHTKSSCKSKYDVKWSVYWKLDSEFSTTKFGKIIFKHCKRHLTLASVIHGGTLLPSLVR